MPSTNMPAGTKPFNIGPGGSRDTAANTMSQPETSKKTPVILIICILFHGPHRQTIDNFDSADKRIQLSAGATMRDTEV